MIDKGKQYRTRDGREVRIYATDHGERYPIAGAVKASNGWQNCIWDKDGRCSGDMEHPIDLIEVRPRIKREVWVNVYPDRMGVPNDNAAYVARHRGRDCLACVKLTIDCEEGQGL